LPEHRKLTKRFLRQPYLWTVALFLTLPWLAFPEIIFGGRTLYWSDLTWMHYPRRIFAAQEWLAGRVPLWDPYQHNGLPFLAESQVGALYPLSSLFLNPLSPSLELSIFILIHFTLAALFTFGLARSLGLSYTSATLSGLVFGLGGFLMAQVPNLNLMAGAIWLPLILLAIIQATQRRSWLAAMGAGVPLALQVLIAQPQVVFYSLVTVAGYGLYRALSYYFQLRLMRHGPPPHSAADSQDGPPLPLRLLVRAHGVGGAWRPAVQALFLAGLAMVTGLLLAAPQLLPTLELQHLSVRAEGRTWDFLTENSLPPAMWVNLVVPSAYGNNVVGFRGGDPFQEDYIYLGLMPLLLIGFSFGQRHRRDFTFFLLLALGGALLAMGRYTPLYAWVIQYLPGFALFRIPARWLMVVSLGLAILAGFGLENLLRRGLSAHQLAVALGVGGGLMVTLGLVWWLRAPLLDWASQNWSELNAKLLGAFLEQVYGPNPAYQDRLLFEGGYWLLTPALLLTINFVIFATIFTLFSRRNITATNFGRLVVAAVALDLILAGGTTINPTQPERWWQQLSGGARYVVEHLDEGRVFPLGMGSEALTVSHLGQYFPSVYRVRSAGGHGSSLMLARTATFLDEAHPVQAIRMLGVRYLLTDGQLGADAAATYPLAYSDGDSYVYENRSPLPRAFVVHQVIQVESAAEALPYIKTADLDPSQTVVVESSQLLPPSGRPSTPSLATIRSETPQRIEIEVSTPADAYLVLLDTFYPGWIASVDGQKTPIYPANYLVRTIFVPQGDHIVWFEYRPLSFWLGVGLATLMLVLMTAAPRFRR
jgi:hypothetical protein